MASHAALQFYTILIGWTLHDQLMIVSDWPNNAFAFENVELYISYSGDILELVHTPSLVEFYSLIML